MARTVLITGGTSGIGAAVAQRFINEGDNVIITGRNHTTVTAAAEHIGATAIACDATDPTQVAALPEHIGDPVDVIFNSAGGLIDADHSDTPPLTKIANAWADSFALNVTSAVLTVEALKDRLADNGRVISVGSIAADTGAGNYGAAKAALANWNISLSQTLAPRGITCNVIAAGYVVDTAFFKGAMTDQRHDRLISQTHNKRPGTVTDIANTAFFLASEGASHITGQSIRVNGGAHTTR
ncbi:SDR family NAD(P)-dependent oxidoreductase [Natronoglycomyces albus]|uniref:SDR family oxidoreductase n=1 Tax=Natronoglycomyces albus TaxID=2811108 RepID=A0A895XTZ1_9ACTN|nr:SDR family oxidoreductase [Natronoglycomyces albus]QSB06795.1 SDR family oxidoreductase [Natronoglycomyces albus]